MFHGYVGYIWPLATMSNLQCNDTVCKLIYDMLVSSHLFTALYFLWLRG